MGYRGFLDYLERRKNTTVWRSIPPPYKLIKPLFLQGFFYICRKCIHLGTLLELPKAISEGEYVKSEQDSVNRGAFKGWFAREFLVGL